MELLFSIVVLINSFLSVGEPPIYNVVSVPNEHTVVVQDDLGNRYTYYQDMLTVDKGMQCIDVDGQLLEIVLNGRECNTVKPNSYIVQANMYEDSLLNTDKYIIVIPVELYNPETTKK